MISLDFRIYRHVMGASERLSWLPHNGPHHVSDQRNTEMCACKHLEFNSVEKITCGESDTHLGLCSAWGLASQWLFFFLIIFNPGRVVTERGSICAAQKCITIPHFSESKENTDYKAPFEAGIRRQPRQIRFCPFGQELWELACTSSLTGFR